MFESFCINWKSLKSNCNKTFLNANAKFYWLTYAMHYSCLKETFSHFLNNCGSLVSNKKCMARILTFNRFVVWGFLDSYWILILLLNKIRFCYKNVFSKELIQHYANTSTRSYNPIGQNVFINWFNLRKYHETHWTYTTKKSRENQRATRKN